MKPLKTTHLAAALLTAFGLCLPVSATAQNPPPRGPEPFSAYDQNGDGAVSAEEFAAHREARQAARGADGRPMRNAGNGPAFADVDTNGDGKLSPDELSAAQGRAFTQRPGGGMGPGGGRAMPGAMPAFADFDLNGDGRIDPQEMQQARQARITERAQAGYPMRGLQNAPAFESLDADGNGSIDAQEFARHHATRPGGMGR